MRRMGMCSRVLPPERKELCDNPVKLCHDISRLTRAKARETAIDGVMSQHGARLVLAILAVNDGVSQKTLVEGTHLRPPTVSVILSRMAEEGMVEFRKNPSDKRQTLVRLTDYGREVDMKGIARIKEIDETALEGLQESERAELMRLLSKIRENLLTTRKEERDEENI